MIVVSIYGILVLIFKYYFLLEINRKFIEEGVVYRFVIEKIYYIFRKFFQFRKDGSVFSGWQSYGRKKIKVELEGKIEEME